MGSEPAADASEVPADGPISLAVALGSLMLSLEAARTQPLRPRG